MPSTEEQTIETLAGHPKATTIDGMRVPTGSGAKTTEVVEAGTTGNALQEPPTSHLVIQGGKADEKHDFPTEALKHMQNKPMPKHETKHTQNNPQINKNIQQPR